MVKILGKEIGHTGFGLMGLTWRPQPTLLFDAITVMKTASSQGAVLWNGGTFYGSQTYNSLHLINAYFTKYPEDAERVVISIKGPVRGDEQNIRSTMEECLRRLDGKKSLDIFQCARVDPRVPIEETVRVLAQYIADGKLGGISLSEASAENIRRAATVHPIACYEVEFSLFAMEIMSNGVAATCSELGIPIVAYSPLGRGFLAGSIQRSDELPEGDVRKPFPRIQPTNFEQNMRLAREVAAIADKKGCSIGQIALASVRYHSGKPGYPEVIPIPGATTAPRVIENMKNVELTEIEYEELLQAVLKFEIVGSRYP